MATGVMATADERDDALALFFSGYGANSTVGVQFLAQMELLLLFSFTGSGISLVAPGSPAEDEDDEDDNDEVSLATRL